MLLENHDGVSHIDVGFSNECVVARHVVIQHLELEPRVGARHVNLEAHSVVKHSISFCDVVLDISIKSLVFYILVTGYEDSSYFAVESCLTFWRPQAVSFPDDHAYFKVIAFSEYRELASGLSNSFFLGLNIHPHLNAALCLIFFRVSQLSELNFRPAISIL